MPTRIMTKKMYPGCYDFSAGGHVQWGETYEDTIKREAEEELGITLYDLRIIKYYNPYTVGVGSFCTNFAAKTNDEIKYNPKEVEKLNYFTEDEIFDMLDNMPEKFKSDYRLMFYDYVRFKNEKDSNK